MVFWEELMNLYAVIPRAQVLITAGAAVGALLITEGILALVIRRLSRGGGVKAGDVKITALKGARSFLRFLFVYLFLLRLHQLQAEIVSVSILQRALQIAVLYGGILAAVWKMIHVIEKLKIETILGSSQAESLFKITRRGIKISWFLFVFSLYFRHLRGVLPFALRGELWMNLLVVLNSLLLTLVLLVLIEKLLPQLTNLSKNGEGFEITVLLTKAVRAPLKLLVLGLFFFSLRSIPLRPAFLVQARGMMGDFLLTAALLLFLYHITDAVIARFSKTSEEETNTLDKTLIEMIRMLLRIVFVGAGIFALIRIATGKPLTTLMAGLGIGGLAVALAAQDTLKNFFGSIMIMADKPFKIGERIAAEGFDGFIESIGFRSTRLRTLTGHQVVIPNDKVAQASIENIGRRPSIRRMTNITITYDTPPEKVEKALSIIREILQDHEGMNPDMPPRVFFNEFNASSLNILVLYWYSPPDYWAFLAFSEDVNLKIMRAFAAEGIDFAFPSQTTYLEQPEGKTLSLSMENDERSGSR